MLTDDSAKSLQAALHGAVAASLVLQGADQYRMAPAVATDIDPLLGPDLLLVTLSSLSCRLLAIFQPGADGATRAYYAGGRTDQPVHEAFSEYANLCGGALSRELSHAFPQLAMSIPFRLNVRCVPSLDVLGPQFRSADCITINDRVRVRVTLSLSCSGPVRIPVRTVKVDHGGGELELFHDGC